MSQLTKLLWAVLILLPALILFSGRYVANQFAPDLPRMMPSEAMRHGAAYGSCDAPYSAAIVPVTDFQGEAECTLKDGRKVLEITAREPVGRGPFVAQGAAFRFSQDYTRRFVGRRLAIEVTGWCEGCAQPVEAFLHMQNGSTGWTDLEFGPELSTQTIVHNAPEYDPKDVNREPIFVLNPYQASGNARFYLVSVAIYELPRRG